MSRVVRDLWPLILGFLLLAATALSAFALTEKQDAATDLVRHTLEVENRLNRVRILVTDAETGQRGFLLTRQPDYLAPYTAAVRDLPAQLERLKAATSDNPDQQALIAALGPAIAAKLGLLAETLTLDRAGHTAEATALVHSGRGHAYMNTVRTIIARMIANEENLLAVRTKAVRDASISLRAIRIVSAVLVVLLAVYVIGDGRRRLHALQAANEQLANEINERASAETQLRQLQKMEAVGQLTGGIAHDFNNMLAIIIGSLDMARRRLSGAEDPRVAKCIDNAAEGAGRAAALTAGLLAFSRQQPLEPSVLDLGKVVGGVSELLRRTLGEQVRVETVLAGGLWRVFADRAQIESALVNLAVNARDAMAPGGRLTIETGNAELDERYAREHADVAVGQYVLLSVTDTGSGMPPEVIERAFEPFYTTKAVGRGTGLGLSQVYGFIKQSRGHMKIYSEIGRGTTVKLYLPRYMGEADETRPRMGTTSALPRGQANELILVAEDEERVREMSVEALRDLGYTVIHAAGGHQALEKLATHQGIALLFTDIVMPDMTGRQLADQAVQMLPELKVLYTTGYTRNAIVHNGIVDYGVSFLAKPFSVSALATKIRETLDAA